MSCGGANDGRVAGARQYRNRFCPVPDRALPWNLAHDNVRCHGRWVSPGAGVATVLWIVASVAFTVYLAKFNRYEKTYGSLGGVVILLTWLHLSALMVLLGAVISAQAERQTTSIPRNVRPGRWDSATRGRPTRWAKAQARGMSMERQEEIDRLKSRLRWERPLAHLANQAVDAFVWTGETLAAWMRQRSEERPLVSLLFAFQPGFAAGRWGPRRAKR